jgi:uncharacterized Zn finger protein (UPF0148 family)
MKDLECPNCGGANPATIKPGQFRCQFCDTRFVDEAMMQRQKAAEKQAARLKAEEMRANAKMAQAKAVSSMSRRVLFIVVIGLLVIFGFVGYMAMKSMEQSQQHQEELIKSFR